MQLDEMHETTPRSSESTARIKRMAEELERMRKRVQETEAMLGQARKQQADYEHLASRYGEVERSLEKETRKDR